ncbi:uncharacterized protein LOC119745057 [Patiria miniata]|uniref:Ig-like domain-containing protein n=1 Tax=Patiria miniata TaxID=46514 RepID=A0A914BLP0_PATMI|nr:uncharacterized protein LOC119745057 [Patiria miniata]
MAPKHGRIILAFVFLWLFLPWMNCQTVVAQLIVDETPQDAQVHIGQEVTFICDLRNAGGYNVFWFHQQRNMYLTTGRKVNAGVMPAELRDRVSVVGRADQEEFSLRIENVQRADGGDYFCQYGLPDEMLKNAGIAVLTVLIPPSLESPYCQVDLISGTRVDRFEVGDEVNFYCYQTDGNPPPDLTLLRGYNQLAGPSRTVTHRYLLTGDDNGVTFTCIMTTPALDEPRNCSVVPLRILPNATILPAVSMVEEGDQASFECYGEGEPIIANYRWRVASVDTGEILPADRYSVFENGRSMEITVMENLELICIVSVPSGLYGNTTARVEVVHREQTMSVSWLLTDKLSKEPPCTCPQNEQLSPVSVALIVVVLVLAVAVIVLIILLVWQRKHYRKSTSPPAGPRMTQAGHEYDDVQDAAEQGQEMQDSAYAAVQEDRDGPITSEYLELQDSPTCKESLEYAYASYPERKNDPTTSGGKIGKAVPHPVKIKKQSLRVPMQYASGYELPSKLAAKMK